MKFDQAFEKLIGHEGGFQNSPNDPGNFTPQGQLVGTNYGISARVYPGEDIPNLTLDRAKAIYLRDYWGPAGCDTVPDSIKFDLFDMAVNAGVKTAIKTLQMAVKADADGVLGPKTLLAVSTANPDKLVARFNGSRLDQLTNLKTWPAYGRGWAKRIAANLML